MSVATFYRDKQPSYFEVARTDIAPLLPALPGRVLEIGCGSGATMRWLRTQRPIVHASAIELMPAAAQAARAVFDEVAVGSAEADPPMLAGEERFDTILALDVLEHLLDPAALVRRLAGRLAPGGCLIASLPNVGHYSVAVPLLLCGRWRYQEAGILDRTHLRFFDEPGVRALFAAPFAVEMLTCNEVVPLVGLAALRRSRHGRHYVRRVMSLLLPRHLRVWQFLVRARIAA